ncbi:MAG: hypothetical protein KBH45_20590 [Verrucomicrobia bacterium]|nr:hypothetical protein [Verrucomicrobiota bacterium]
MKPPSFRTTSVLLVLLSLSIGWGIRGNYGHEAGAMIPGALTAIAAALMSGREDWRRRVPYFAFFGALGWAFGGSIAYMHPPTYTETGHLATQVYGFLATFFEAFLWAGLGGAATAYAAVEEREKLTAIFRPLLWVFGFWAVQYFMQDTPFDLQGRLFRAFGADHSDFRQRDPLYWLDSEWLEAVLALTALCLFDLWDRRFSKFGHLVLLTLGGAVLGLGVQQLLAATGWQTTLVNALVHPQGDLTLLDPTTGAPKFAPEDMLTNWPVILSKIPRHIGWSFGAVGGMAIYFWRYGAWRSGSALLMRMALWSMIVFLVGPVLLSNLPVFQSVGGFRFTPPRGDSWANILGCYIGLILHFRKTGQQPVVFAAVLSGALGGLALTTAQFVKVLCITPGNPRLTDNPAVIEFWHHWRSANWHSLALEQFAGFLYGLAILIPMGMLASRIPVRRTEPRVRPWTEIFAVVFVFNLVAYINIVKNIEDWTSVRKIVVNGAQGTFQSVADFLRAPLIGKLTFSSWTWFTLMWFAFTACTVAVLMRHRKHPVALIPSTWLGKGQLLYLLFLWLIVVANFTKAVVAFSDGRIATEGTVMFNALICTFLLLGFARQPDEPPPFREANFGRLICRSVVGLCLLLLATTAIYTTGIRALYGNQTTGWGGNNLRFGPNADWRVKPLLRSKRHN